MLAISALCASVAFNAEAVESSVVGYGATAAAAETYYMVTAQFDNVGGTGAGMALNELVRGAPYGTELSLLKANGTYDIFKYIAEAYDAVKDDFVPGWGDVLENLATQKVVPGTTFWLKTPSSATPTIAGAVLADSSKEVTVAGGVYSMIGNPYPVAVNPNTLTWTGLTYGDELSVMQANGTYAIYKYIAEAYDAEKDDFVPGWADVLENKVTTGVVPVGQGAWIKPAGEVKVTWVSPL